MFRQSQRSRTGSEIGNMYTMSRAIDSKLGGSKVSKLQPSVNSVDIAERINKFLWSDAYIITIEESFDQIFEEIYEPEFVDKIYMETEAVITKKEFMEEFTNSLKPMNWIFQPSILRKLF